MEHRRHYFRTGPSTVIKSPMQDNKSRLRVVLIFLFINLTSAIVYSQDKCATVEVQVLHKNKSQIRESDDQFENWLSEAKVKRLSKSSRSGAYIIPVVVHVIHKGEAIGVGANISDAQIESQIRVLNKDFTRTNSDASQTPSEFSAVAGLLNIQFVLAKRDPSGNATNGINRVKGTKTQWSTSDETTLKSQSYWPAEDYLNIWVTDLSSSLLGYAQFPVSSLAGLESATDNRLTDGVVIDYTVFGSADDGSFSLDSNFDKGRSATHEVGHFFGLRHIWADDSGSCSGTDYVEDTPNQGNSTSGCPTFPQTSCSVHTMFQNYMDYTNDECMNLFTKGQSERMITVIENSPRRASLRLSTGAEDPEPVLNDLALVAFVNTASSRCAGEIIPEISVTNAGSNSVTEAVFTMQVNGQSKAVSVNFDPLKPGMSTTIKLNTAALQQGSNTISIDVTSVNGQTDGKASDNNLATETYAPYETTLPYGESFITLPQKWRLLQSANVNWTVTTAPKELTNNTALYLNGFGVASGSTTSAVMFSPRFSLENATGPYVIFDLSYAQASSGDNSSLKLYVIDGCADDYTSGKLIFERSGKALSTAGIKATSFTPTSDTDWVHYVVDLKEFKGRSGLRLAVLSTSSSGNNLYIDNFKIVTENYENISIARIAQPSPVMCSTSGNAVMTIRNYGRESLTSVKMAYTLNSGKTFIKSFTGIDITPGAATDLTLSDLTFKNGKNELHYELTEPNGLFDIDPSDNTAAWYFIVNDSTDIVPMRQNFEKGWNAWSAVAPASNGEATLAQTNFSASAILAKSLEDSLSGTWFVSPRLNLTDAQTAGMFFSMAQAISVETGRSASDTNGSGLHVLASIDCGMSYQDTLFSKPSIIDNILTGNPNSNDDWSRQFINLDKYAGMSDVRLAFVYRSKSADLFLDNIEIFLSDNPDPLTIDSPYAVYGTSPAGTDDFIITFNLDDRQTVRYSLTDMSGRELFSQIMDDVLNQTIRVEPEISAGIYLLKLQIGTSVYYSRVYLNN